MEKQIPDIYNFDYFTDISGNSNDYEIIISFNNNRISKIMLDTYDVTEYYDGGIFRFKDILKKVKKNFNNNKYNTIKNDTSFVIYFRYKLNTHMKFFNTGNRSSYDIEDKSFVNGIYMDEINLLFGKNANNDDYVKITLIKISRNIFITHNRKALAMIGKLENFKQSIPIYTNYKSSLIFVISGTKKYKDLNFIQNKFNKKIILPITYPDGKGEIECHVFDKSSNNFIVYTCYITKLILPNGQILNIQSNNLDKIKQKKCNCCLNFYNKFDISIESKYKLICEMELLNFNISLMNYYNSDDYNIRFEPGDLNIFKENMSNDVGDNIYVKVIN
jgi:hypothetical protein